MNPALWGDLSVHSFVRASCVEDESAAAITIGIRTMASAKAIRLVIVVAIARMIELAASPWCRKGESGLRRSIAEYLCLGYIVGCYPFCKLRLYCPFMWGNGQSEGKSEMKPSA